MWHGSDRMATQYLIRPQDRTIKRPDGPFNKHTAHVINHTDLII